MSLNVLASDKNNPIVGETLPNGAKGFDADSYHKPAGYTQVQTKAGTVKLPIFTETLPPSLKDLKWYDLKEFLKNELIVKVNGFDRDYINTIFSSSEEELDEIVHEVCAEAATEKMNQTADEEEQESILSTFEKKASYINNQGKDAQILYLLCD